MCSVNLNDSSGFETLHIENHTIYTNGLCMIRYIYSPSLKTFLVTRAQGPSMRRTWQKYAIDFMGGIALPLECQQCI